MELLKSLYGIMSPSGNEGKMTRFLQRHLEQIPGVRYCIDHAGNLYAVKGKSETYPCVVAHMDEVHYRPQTGYEVVSLHDNIVLGYNSVHNTFCGIGADDKNGIWVALKCLERYDALKCVFFTQEERGCIGSQQADMEFFQDCRFVLQCDRRGNSDMVVNIDGTALCSKEFIHDVKAGKHGYKRSTGFLSDVAALKRKGLAVSCVNLSCGYYEPHTDREYTVVRDLQKCFEFVCHIIETCTNVYAHTYKPPKSKSFAKAYGWRDYDDLFERHAPQTANRHETEYQKMFTRMTHILNEDPTCSLQESVRALWPNYPSLGYTDYATAYNEITRTCPQQIAVAAI